METITMKRGISTASGAVAGMVSQVGHLGQHRFWAPEEFADDTIGASRFLVILSTAGAGDVAERWQHQFRLSGLQRYMWYPTART